MNFENYTQEVQGGITVAKMVANPQISLTRSVNTISIPSKTAMVTKVKVNNSDSNLIFSLVEPVTSVPTKLCTMCAQYVSEVKNGYVFVKLIKKQTKTKPNQMNPLQDCSLVLSKICVMRQRNSPPSVCRYSHSGG